MPGTLGCMSGMDMVGHAWLSFGGWLGPPSCAPPPHPNAWLLDPPTGTQDGRSTPHMDCDEDGCMMDRDASTHHDRYHNRSPGQPPLAHPEVMHSIAGLLAHGPLGSGRAPVPPLRCFRDHIARGCWVGPMA